MASSPQQRSVLVRHVLATGERRQLTEAPAGLFESKPRVSPDGKRLAFIRYRQGQSALFVMPLTGGEPTRVGEWSNLIGGLTWTPDATSSCLRGPN